MPMQHAQPSILGTLPLHTSLSWAHHDPLSRSRHRTEYDILKTLGRGAFGTTFMVRNRVDSRTYAMKTVKLGGNGDGGAAGIGTEECDRVLREVEFLSGLGGGGSDNVVRYYGAWAEKGDMASSLGDGDGDGGGDSFRSNEFSEEASRTNSSDERIDVEPDPTCHLCKSSYKDWEVSFEQWGLIDAVLQPLNLCTACYMDSIPPGVDSSTIAIREKRRLPVYLFILMEYCESTLQEAVQRCNGDESAIWSIFAQCARGLAHLHSRGIIHRDVKPSNVFVHRGVVKIGDLGLATYASSSSAMIRCDPATCSSNGLLHDQTVNSVSADDAAAGSKSSQVGTFLYTAPEVSSGKYDEKCDVFSLGIVLVEMFSNFGTAMERADVLMRLRSGERLPKEWEEAHRVHARLAKRMVAPGPADRPSCGEVLAELIRERLWTRPNCTVMQSAVVDDLHARIAELETSLERKVREVEDLRRLLGENGISHDHIA